MKDYLKLLKFVKSYWFLFIIAAVFMGFTAIFDGASIGMIVPLADNVLTGKKIVVPVELPLFLDSFINTVNQMAPLLLLKIMAFVVLAVIFLKGVVSFVYSYLMSDIGQKVMRDMRAMLYGKFLDFSLDFYSRKKAGELISRITNDVRVVENAVSYGFTDLIYQSFQIVVFTCVVLFINWKLSLFIFVALPLLVIPIVKVGKKLRKLSKVSQEKMADINSSINETIFGIRIVKAFCAEQYEKNKFNMFNISYYKVMMKSIKRTLILSPATEFVGAAAGIFVFFFGGKEVIEGRMSFGVFGLFLGSLLSMIRPFKKLGQVNSLIQQAVAASVRIYEIIDEPPSIVDTENAVKLEAFNEKIVFDNVRFSYEVQEVLKGINLTVNKNEFIAIVGPSGAGKSTLLDLIPRFYDPTGGGITIDGRDVRGYSIFSLRRQIGIVSQETILFNDSVKANIAYGVSNYSSDDIMSAAKKANAHEFIMNLSNGYDTVIGDRGFKLSGGEKQRLAIARAMLKNPQILILDEATSQLDTQSERLVQDALDRLMESRTVFVIAHRLSTVKNADRIMVIDKGSLVQLGTHTELVNKEGVYKHLYDMQFVEKS
ncbi:MAG: ABC transporter ATP-binding protein [Candidatus Gygaella obscura]|nr:ABC transporter ATP-binding protein [Candidatus Gygaella obscura]